jgi:hypothetical protein
MYGNHPESAPAYAGRRGGKYRAFGRQPCDTGHGDGADRQQVLKEQPTIRIQWLGGGRKKQLQDGAASPSYEFLGRTRSLAREDRTSGPTNSPRHPRAATLRSASAFLTAAGEAGPPAVSERRR